MCASLEAMQTHLPRFARLFLLFWFFLPPAKTNRSRLQPSHLYLCISLFGAFVLLDSTRPTKVSLACCQHVTAQHPPSIRHPQHGRGVLGEHTNPQLKKSPRDG